jgi:two-component system, OmpR family, alkaline phosphatase synthesis response regulator PhoP
MSKGRILCVEDDLDSLQMLSMLLTSNGYEVVCTDDSKNALQIAQEQQFDLLLLDNWLPEVSGVELTKRLREFDTYTPVVFYSGVAQQRDQLEALEAGAQLYLTKPIGVNDLIEEIDRRIRSQKPDLNKCS